VHTNPVVVRRISAQRGRAGLLWITLDDLVSRVLCE